MSSEGIRLTGIHGVIDLDRVCEMVDAYLNTGMNYFDTAYVYHGGDSEKIVKEALVKRYPRESFTIATKLPAWVLTNYSSYTMHELQKSLRDRYK